ncbi:MAG TPA: hypothetical protein VIJ55_17095 [Acetobacteraceae bacterium]
MREFVAVVTRAQLWAQAETVSDAATSALLLAHQFDILEDGSVVWDRLVDLCRTFAFGGRQVHDANIVATMLAHGEKRLRTFNAADFRRFLGVIELAPIA